MIFSKTNRQNIINEASLGSLRLATNRLGDQRTILNCNETFCKYLKASNDNFALLIIDNHKCHFPSLSLSETLLGNPRGPVEQGNPNTCAEVKLCLFFIYSDSKSSLLQD